MNGRIVETTVTQPLTGIDPVGQSIHDILPPASAMKYINTLFLALTQNKRQWTDYTVAGQTFVVLCERLPKTDTFVVHETPYEGSIDDIKARLRMAAENYKKIDRELPDFEGYSPL